MISKSGFTLLELLVVVAIIAILSCLSYPLYTKHFVKVRRKQAQIELLHLAGRLESQHHIEGSYDQITPEQLSLSVFNQSKSYHFQLDQLSAQAYRISAIPKGHQARCDRLCKTLSLNEKGQRFISGHGSVDDCWR